MFSAALGQATERKSVMDDANLWNREPKLKSFSIIPASLRDRQNTLAGGWKANYWEPVEKFLA
jgi:hypothetical protein